MSEAAIAVPGPRIAPYTVDDLFEMPDDGNRYEVLGGSLVVSPAPTPRHQLAADALCRTLWAIKPVGTTVLTAVAVRMPDGDGPIPDVVVMTADPQTCGGAVPHQLVHTVVEVVSPSHALVDRAYKRELYAEAGIPCYWRVELEPWRAYQGPVPLVVVRVLTADGWHAVEVAAGTNGTLPLAVARQSSAPSSAARRSSNMVTLVGC